MSTDWDAACFTCKLYTHLGQRFTSGPAFGYGSNDAQGRLDAAEFVSEHVHHDLRIVLDAPDDFTKYELPADRTKVEPPVKLLIMPGEECDHEACDGKPATEVAQSGETKKLGAYCATHARMVADDNNPEYIEHCPNCGCVFGA